MVALRTNLIDGALSMFDLIYIAFSVLTVLIIQASFKRRPDDPLIALSDAESDSE